MMSQNNPWGGSDELAHFNEVNDVPTGSLIDLSPDDSEMYSMKVTRSDDVPNDQKTKSFIKAVTCDVDTAQLLAEVRRLRTKNSQNEKMIEDLKCQLDDSKAHRKEITKLLTNELKLKDVHIQKLNDMLTKNTEEFISQLAKSREIYDEQIKYIAVTMARTNEENRLGIDEAIEMLSGQMAEVVHLLENKQ